MRAFLGSIERARTIAIFSHLSPDADALCGSFALKNIIKNNFDGKVVDVFSDGQIGELYDHILRDEVVNPLPLRTYDLAIVLDSTSIERVGKYSSMVRCTPQILNIDHHDTNEWFGTNNIVAPKFSSTCEILYLLARNNRLEIDNTIAKSLFQGIITDTNNFTSKTTSSVTRMIAEELKQYKFDHMAIKDHYFKNDSEAKKLLMELAMNTMKYYCNNKLVTMMIDNAAFNDVCATFEDTLGIVDKGLKESGAEVGTILIENKQENIYVSLRGQGAIDLGAIAKRNGGGSRTIAAYQTTGNIHEEESRLVKDVVVEFDSNDEDELHIDG